MAEAGPKANVIPLSTVAAYFLMAVSIVLGLSYFFDWVAARYDWPVLTAGRRIDLGSILAISIGLLITRLIGRWLLPEPRTDRD